LDIAKNVVQSLEEQVANLQATRQQLEKELEANRANQAHLTSAALDRETALAKDLKQAQGEVTQLRQQLQKATQLSDTLTAQKAVAEENYRQAQIEVRTLGAQKLNLDEELKTSRERLTTLEEQISALEQQLNPSIQSLQTATTRAASLEQQVAVMIAERNRLTEDLQQANQTVKQLKEHVQALQTIQDSPSQREAERIPSGIDTVKSARSGEVSIAVDLPVESKSVEPGPIEPISNDNPQILEPDQLLPHHLSRSLEGKSVVLTGHLSSRSSQQMENLIVAAGGRVTKTPSAKTAYIVVGRNPGSKLKKAEKYNTPHMTEEQFLLLLGISSES